MIEAHEKILFARRRLEEVKDIEIIKDIQWDDNQKSWYMLIQVSLNNSNSKIIPSKTMWYMVFDKDYPNCDIKVYPAVMGGINNTFNHQNNNGLICPNNLWRMGKLCLNNPFDSITGLGEEPNSYEEKLFWNAKRMVKWVNDASQNSLIHENDYYEIPDFNTTKTLKTISKEDIVSMLEWESNEKYYGYVDFTCDKNGQMFSCDFKSISGDICKTTRWGKYVDGYKDRITGAWIKLEREPVINGWQAPNTFEELCVALQLQGLDLKKILTEILPRFRDAKKHIIMIGFPIPEKFGQKNEIIHWESFLLPVISYGKKTAKGFRCNEVGWSRRDFQDVFTDKMRLEWMITQNWDPNEMLNRGRFQKNVLRERILLIGVGTLGGYIAENLVRGGVYKLTVMDDDVYTIGNSARHLLTVKSIYKSKAYEMAKRLNSINPNIDVKVVDKQLSDKNIQMIESYDVIIDCTASNNVLRLLGAYSTKKEKTFISISFGYNANILFFSYQKNNQFNLKRYADEFAYKMRENERSISYENLPWDGIGCWNPVFPAMAADVQLVASLSTQIIKDLLENSKVQEVYYVYEKQLDENGVIKGFARI